MGFWTLHPTFVPEQAKNCIDTGDKVFYLVSGSLYCLDKETLENESYTKANYLSDVKTINGIYYNYAKRYLAIVYDNSNIDFITNEGRIVNLPEIKDAILTSSKSVTDITFTDNGNMYVSTDFGYIVVDDSRFVIKESHVYHKPISSIVQVGQKLVAIINDTICVSPIDQQHDVISSFVPTTVKFAGAHLYPINASRLFFYNTSMFYVGTLGGTAEKPKVTLSGNSLGGYCDGVQHTPSGFLANFMQRGYYYTFDTNGTNATKNEGGNEIYTCTPGSSGTMWAVGPNGLHKSGETSNYYRPNAISITTTPFWASYDPQLGLFYLQTSGDNFMLTRTADNNLMEINTYDGNTWKNATPDKLGTDKTGYSGYKLTVNPRDAHTYFFSTRDRGIYKVTDGKTVDIYYQGTKNDYVTTPNFAGTRYRGTTAFDNDGNLWVVTVGGKATSSTSNVVALPSANVNSTTPVTTDNWKKITIPNILNEGSFKRASFVISDNIKLFNDGDYNRPTFVWRDGINTANPDVRTIKNLTDQDGKAVTWTYLKTMAIDMNGHVWMGVDGIIEFDPHDIFNDNFRVNHVKVPRNDGTGLADYLLEGISVNCIAVDAYNRKWIGTTTGLYQVSADGTQVLREFNTTNSMLPHDNVFDVACNTRDNTVYIVTGGGVVEYNDSGASSATDLSNVYCYPNPVRPDFTGLLTISGLPNNTLVKIADSAGNVIKQVRSSSGIATWDCCGSDGNRVATGVYYVLASTSESGSNSNIVAKFLVVK
ncbi:MAG: hypothetical protein IJT30_04270 [Muribaculaceae bacterium]|nr:hypothetical protein [Muribaculaceae bacterium]